MACVDLATWKQAQADCAATKAIKGLGRYSPYASTLGALGLTISAGGSVTPSSLYSSTSSGVSPTVIKTTSGSAPVQLNVTPGTDPCVIAQMTPCNANGVPIPKPLLAAPPKKTLISTVDSNGTPVTLIATDPSSAGFSKLGLLALLAVGGFVVYKVATHKKGASA